MFRAPLCSPWPGHGTDPQTVVERETPMKKLFAVATLVALAACGGEKPAATPAADTTAAAPAVDTTAAQTTDSAAAAPADTTMARDTAKQM